MGLVKLETDPREAQGRDEDAASDSGRAAAIRTNEPKFPRVRKSSLG